MIFFKQYQKRIEMKRIEATIQATKIGADSDALNDIVGGFTILEGKGRGSGVDNRSDQAEEQVQLLQNTMKLQLYVQSPMKQT